MLRHADVIRDNCVPTFYASQSPRTDCSVAYRCRKLSLNFQTHRTKDKNIENQKETNDLNNFLENHNDVVISNPAGSSKSAVCETTNPGELMKVVIKTCFHWSHNPDTKNQGFWHEILSRHNSFPRRNFARSINIIFKNNKPSSVTKQHSIMRLEIIHNY